MTKGKDSSVSVTREMMCWILTQEVREGLGSLVNKMKEKGEQK